MKLTIRRKLILLVCVPLIVISTGLAGVNHWKLSAAARSRLEDRVVERAKTAAAQLDALCRRAAQVAESTAAVLTIHPTLTEEELYAVVEHNVRQDELIYGSCIAFAPGAFSPGRQLFAPYAFEHDDDVRSIDIGQESYDYTEPKWEWYGAAKDLGKAVWTEPYFDKDAGNILMCTYSVPFFRDGEFHGVATVDIPIAKLQQQVEDSYLGEGRFVVTSRNGKFISHPNPDYVMIETVASMRDKGEPEWSQLFEQARSGKSGDRRVLRIDGPVPSWMSHAPISSPTWSYGVAIPESQVLRPLYDVLRSQIFFGLLGLGLVLCIVLVVSYRLTKPIERIALAVQEVGKGNLDTQVKGVQSGDELDDLARVFNLMIRQLKVRIQKSVASRDVREPVEREVD
ncbi:MAG: HAMP domain-containing protein [Planctomycetes bacterium]|nr:HAMP domain-containing protein [Planctomycetota bacterium]